MPQRVRSTVSKGFLVRVAAFFAARVLKQMATDRFNGLLRNAWILGATELRIIYTFGEGIRAVCFERKLNDLKEVFTSTSFDGDDYNELLLRFSSEESTACSPLNIEFGEPNVTVSVNVTRRKAYRSETLIFGLDFDPPYSSLAD